MIEKYNLQWYALRHDFNEDKVEAFNIFNSINFNYWCEKAIKDYKDYKQFKEDLRGALFYAFGSKVEYEIICAGVVAKHGNEFKIDIYEQVLPNLDILAKYILTEVNKHKRNKLVF